MTAAIRWSKFIVYSTLLVVFLIAVTPTQAQNSQGTILGHVQDPTGAALPGVRVTATNVNTNISNHFTTNSTGDYVFVDMIPGTYRVKVESDGFKTEVSSNLILEVDQTLRQDFTLRVGQIKEVMTITADAQMVQTDNTTTGNVLDQKTIEELPSSGRDFNNLLNLVAGAANVNNGSQVDWALHGLNSNFTEVSVNGARPDSVSFLVDGVADTDAFFATASNIPSEFSIQEVKIQTGLYSAEYGQGSGQINVAIKSGTNQWHGQAYDYIQNDAFQPKSPLYAYENSVTPIGTPLQPLKQPLKQNQFGGTLGGPVRIPFLYNGRDKTFWFFAYDGGRKHFGGGLSYATVPTLLERGGNFSDWPYQLYDPATTQCTASGCDPTTRQPYTSNQIPTTEINSMGQRLASIYPKPNINCSFTISPTGQFVPCLNYAAAIYNSITTDNETMRVDQNFGEKDRVYFTGHIRHDYEPNPSIMPYSGTVAFTNGQLLGLNWERTLGSKTVNQARFAYNHQFYSSNANTAYGPNIEAQLGFVNTPPIPALYAIPVITLYDSYSNIGIGSGGNGLSTKHTSFQWVDNLKLIRGKHTLTIGADIRRLREFEQDNYLGTGSIQFNGEYTATNPSGAGGAGPGTGNAVADMLLSDESYVSGPAPLGVDYLHTVGTNWNFFFQDDFRVTPRLTVNLGLRYEIPPNYHSIDNSGWTLDPANGGSLIWVSKSFVQNLEQIAAGQGVTLNPNFVNCCVQNTLVPIDKKDFAPRIGISWRPFSTGRFVVRAGYGIFYDTYMRYYDQVQNFDNNLLQTQVPSTSYNNSGNGTAPASPDPPLNQLWLPPASAVQLFSIQGWNTPAFSSVLIQNQVEYPWNHNPYNQQWTLDMQYALKQDLLLDVGYVGSHGLRLPTYLALNAAYAPKVPSDPCNFLFDISQATGSNASCATDPNFQPIDTRVPYPNLPSNVYANANVLSANYNSLQVQLRQRFSHGLTYQVSYTYSKALDESSGIINIGGLQAIVQDPHNVKGDYGPASFDQTHRLTANGSWDLPVGKGRRWSFGRPSGWKNWALAEPANWVLGDWKISGIYTATSGRTFSLYGYTGPTPDEMGAYFTCCGLERYRLNESSNPKTGFTQTLTEWFNTSVVSPPPPGTYGNSQKGSVRGPYIEDLDLSFGKVFPITERHQLQYRLEMFNVGSNWHSFGRIPDNNFTDGNFGSLVQSQSAPYTTVSASKWASLNLWTPRVLQMSLVYSF
jgi:hypothetical protein